MPEDAGPSVHWDRGTLVLAGKGAAELPGVVWDPRTGSHRAPAWRYRETAETARARGLQLQDEVFQRLEPPARMAAPSLRPYQAAAVASWRAASSRGVIVLPTGSGKTRTAIAAIASSSVRTLVLVPTRVLLDQWISALHAAGCPSVGRFGDGNREVRPVTVCTFASARIHMADLGNRFELLVVDECHHFGSDRGDEILELSAAPMRLGLTATLPEDEDRRARLARAIGPPAFESSVSELAGRFLAPFDLVSLSVSLAPGERREYDAAVARYRPWIHDFFTASPGATWPQLVAAAMRSEPGRKALQSWRRSRRIVALAGAKVTVVHELLARHCDQRTLVFTANNRAAYAIARQLLVMPITCDIRRAEREDVLARFADGRLSALVSARVLNEGVDVPEAEVAILVSGSQGSREYVQRVGRVLRPREHKRATVYELVVADTHEARQQERGRRRLAGEGPAAVPRRR